MTMVIKSTMQQPYQCIYVRGETHIVLDKLYFKKEAHVTSLCDVNQGTKLHPKLTHLYKKITVCSLELYGSWLCFEYID